MARLTSTRTRFWQAARMGSKSALRGAAPLAGLPNTRTLGSAATIDLLAGESQGLAIDFTYPTGLGTVQVLDTTTPANCLNFVPADSFLTQSGTSPKLVLWSDGLYRWTAHNLILQSQAFDNAAWTKSGTSAAAGTADPLGGTNAQTISGFDTNGDDVFQTVGTVAGATYTFAIWLRSASPATVRLREVSGAAFNQTVSVTATWQQFTVTFVAGAAAISPAIQWLTGDTFSSVEVYGAQLNRGSTALAYHVTTAAAWYGVPIEYDPTTAKFYALVEPQATNLALYASDFTNAAWVKSNMTAALTATGPDGVANSASTLTATAGNATALQAITSASASRVTSMFVKRRTGSGNIDLTQDNGSTWATQTVTAAWTRVSLVAATAANPTVGIRIVTSGDAVDVAWFQHELTAVTSPIPTFAATVTRGVDKISVAASAFPSTATALTLIMSAAHSPLGVNNIYFDLVDAGRTDRFLVFVNPALGNAAEWRVTDNSVDQADVQSAAAVITSGTWQKVGVAAAANDFTLYVDGVVRGTPDTSGTMPNANDLLVLGQDANFSEPFTSKWRTLVLVPRRMTNAELVAKTL